MQVEPEPGFLHAIEPELVVPIVVYLASRACELTHHNFSACAGRFARVFVGLGDGWLADGGAPTAEDLAEPPRVRHGDRPLSGPDLDL